MISTAINEPRCKHCGCSQANACIVNGRACHWVFLLGIPLSDEEQDLSLGRQSIVLSPRDLLDNVCSNPACVDAEYHALTSEASEWRSMRSC